LTNMSTLRLKKENYNIEYIICRHNCSITLTEISVLTALQMEQITRN